ncbi:MAG: adenylate/guanylate cyclase domain-containing protein [Candidatus Eremiobacteraeota bacterium]|nr:adenylate/guanylate cyclase domain-containing protein [Candidatus Eremiobacteraeota bacterium]
MLSQKGDKKKDKKKLGRAGFLFFCAILIFLFMIAINQWGILASFNSSWWDDLMVNFGKRPPHRNICLLSINRSDTDKYGPFPWNRILYAKVVDFLKEAGAEVIAFDFYMRKEIPSEDREFIRSIRNHGKVILAQPWDYNEMAPEEPPKSFKESGAYFGHVVVTDRKVYRYLPLVYMNPLTDTRKSFDENIYCLSLSLLSVQLFKDYEKEPITTDENGFFSTMQLKDISIPFIKASDEKFPYRMMIDYSGSRRQFIKLGQEWPISIILDEKRSETSKALLETIRNRVKGCIVLIYNSLDPHDTFYTPYSRQAAEDQSDDDQMPGGVIHAFAISSILNNAFTGYNAYFDWLLPLVPLFLGAFIFSRPIKWSIRIFFFCGLCGLWVLICALSFIYFHTLINLYTPLTGLLLLFIALIFYERKQFISYFGQFVSHRLGEEILKDETRAHVGTREVEATIIFADIRGFSTISEKLSPVELTKLMTEYHTEMNKIFDKNRGTILDYLGDAEMVGFGVIDGQKEHALLAIKSGLEMQAAIAGLREKWGLVKGMVFEVGVGICTGPVAEGVVGSDSKAQLVAMGDTTNTAARIQALSKDLDSLVTISDSCYVKVKDEIESDPLKEMPLKGKVQKVMLHRVRAVRPETLKRLEKVIKS